MLQRRNIIFMVVDLLEISFLLCFPACLPLLTNIKHNIIDESLEMSTQGLEEIMFKEINLFDSNQIIYYFTYFSF